MNKRELAVELAKQNDLTRKEAIEIINSMLAIFRNSIENGERIIIHGFGSFIVREFKEREVISPVTSDKITIEARKRLKFTPSKDIVIK